MSTTPSFPSARAKAAAVVDALADNVDVLLAELVARGLLEATVDAGGTTYRRPVS